jgi:hypothetical protein
MNTLVDLLPNSMSFRFVSTIETRSVDAVPPGFTGRVRVVTGGRLECVVWFSGGDMDNPEPRTPAFVRYRQNGKPKQVRHYRMGRLHDPALGHPAVEGYFADGSIKYREHFRYGRRHDCGASPAITKWRNDGGVRVQHHYYEGLRIEPVRQQLAS